MWWFIILKPKIKVPVSKYFTGFWELIYICSRKKERLGCDDNQFRWFEHFILVIGYLGLLFTTVVLDWFSSENLFIIVLGYVLSIIVFAVTSFLYQNVLGKEKS